MPVATILARTMFNPDSDMVSVFLHRPVQYLMMFVAAYAVFTCTVWFYFSPHRKRLLATLTQPRRDAETR